MRRLASHLTYSRVVSTLALFIALGGGAYAVSLGKNDVKSRNLAKGAVKSSDVARNTLKGADVKPDSLKGSDILESTLATGQFTAAASTPFNPAGPITCDPEFGSGPAFAPCGEVSLTTPVAGRILVIASGELIADGGVASGDCRVYLDGEEIGALGDRARGNHGFSLSAVSGPVALGAHVAELRCLEGSGELHAEVNSITAVLVGG